MTTRTMIEESAALYSIKQEMTVKVSKRIIEDLVCVTNRLYALDCYLAQYEEVDSIEEIREACIKPAMDFVALSRWMGKVKNLSDSEC